jgi:tetratricopeptide (TPR) repeat protein
MTRYASILAAVALVAWMAGSAQADTVRTAKASITGAIEGITKYEVKIKRNAPEKVETVPANEIESIRFDGEPAQLNLVRSAVSGGRYEEALRGLEKLATDGIQRKEILQEIEYFKAISTARLALAGAGATVNEAGTLMNGFVAKNPESWHFLEASEVLGDLLIAINKPDDALKHYASLEQAPATSTKMRGGVAKGRALQASKKFDEALAAFEDVLKQAGDASAEGVEAQKQAAIVGKATCLAETGKAVEGVKLLEEVIAKADPEQAELHAQAYNALGNCHRQAKNDKAALMAYLHVDVLYNSNPSAHAEALANLKDLWKSVGNAERSAQAEQVLLERYANSRWAKQ